MSELGGSVSGGTRVAYDLAVRERGTDELVGWGVTTMIIEEMGCKKKEEGGGGRKKRER